jgi:ubiquinone/menaquinone biosynthesis C-methylase UbiE
MVVKQLRLAWRALWLVVRRAYANTASDYDEASKDYDTFFSRVMGRHAIAMVDELRIEPGMDVVELACGTGHITEEVARRLADRGSIRTVDQSPGMLGVAQRKLAAFDRLDLTVEQGDMMDFLARQPDASADVVICGWAICYTKPVQLLQQVMRVLRPGGQVAVIETREDAMAALMQVFEHVVMNEPSLLQRWVRISLPKNSQVMRRWFTRAGVEVVGVRDGSQELPCHTADEALEWVERSGAAAGFKDAFDRSREAELRERLHAELERYIVKHGPLTLHHTFVTGVGRRPALAPVRDTAAVRSA